jgi:hypothetical protein
MDNRQVDDVVRCESATPGRRISRPLIVGTTRAVVKSLRRWPVGSVGPLLIEGQELTIGRMSKLHYRSAEKVRDRCGSPAAARTRTRLATSLAWYRQGTEV